MASVPKGPRPASRPSSGNGLIRRRRSSDRAPRGSRRRGPRVAQQALRVLSLAIGVGRDEVVPSGVAAVERDRPTHGVGGEVALAAQLSWPISTSAQRSPDAQGDRRLGWQLSCTADSRTSYWERLLCSPISSSVLPLWAATSQRPFADICSSPRNRLSPCLWSEPWPIWSAASPHSSPKTRSSGSR